MSSQVKSNPETVVVSFPCVHGTARGDLVRITCFRSNELKGAIKVVSAIDEEIAKRIIGATRHGESSPSAAHGVIALFSNPMFGGESYGLALAICDKMVRLETTDQRTQVIATGEIPYDGCGKIKSIEGLAEKLNTVAGSAANGAIFIFPHDNLDDTDEEIGSALDLLEKRGIQWRAIKHIDELDGELWSLSQTVGDDSFRNAVQKLKSRITEIKEGFSTHKLATVSIFFSVVATVLFFMSGMYRGEGQNIVNTQVKESPLQEMRMKSPESNEAITKKSESPQFITPISTVVDSGSANKQLDESRVTEMGRKSAREAIQRKTRDKAIESIEIKGAYY